MYVITAHQRHGQTDRRTDVKRSHDRYIAKACSGKKWGGTKSEKFWFDKPNLQKREKSQFWGF